MRSLRKAIAVTLSVAALAAIVHVYHPGAASRQLVTGGAGYTATIDASGEFVEAPALVMPIKDGPGPNFSTSSEGLSTETSPVPGGGQMIDLQGRFRHSMSVNAVDGQLESDCTTDDGASEVVDR